MKLNHIAVVLAFIAVMGFAGVAQADGFSETIEVFKRSPVVQPFF